MNKYAIDIIGIVGVCLLGFGLYLFDEKVAYIVIGALFITYAIKANK